MSSVKEKDESKINQKNLVGPTWRLWRYKRYIISLLAFLGFANKYALRSNLNIAIVDMIALKNVTLDNGTTIMKREFEWDSALQGQVLGSFFYGYVFSQVLGGYLATKLGGVKMFAFGLASTSLFTLISPWIVKNNVYLFIAVRAIEGLCEGVTIPSMQQVWSHWAPPAEKSRLVSCITSGGYFGSVVAMLGCSLLTTAFGWESVFYTFGTIGAVWSISWFILVGETPAEDRWIRPEERKYIIDAVSTVKSNETVSIPWCKIITSPAVLAFAICCACEGWGFYTILTYLPQLMTSLLGFSLNQSGLLSALPYLLTVIITQISCALADYIINKKYLSITHTRKLLIIFGMFVQVTMLIVAGYWVSTEGITFCMILAVGISGAAASGLSVIPLDIAPKFASIIHGFSSTLSSLTGMVSPIVTGYILTDQKNLTQWRTIFFIAASIYTLGIIICFLFMTGERQSWADKIEFVPESEHKNPKEYRNKNGVENEGYQSEK